MNTTRYSDAQDIGIFEQAKGGVPVLELYREHRTSSARLFKLRAKFGGLD